LAVRRHAAGGGDHVHCRAAAYSAANRFPAALADLDEALRVAPDNVGLWAQRANVDRQRNDPVACREDYDAALKLKPGEPELLALRGQAKLEAGDAKAAYDDLAEASRKAPDNAVVRRIFAVWDVDAGDVDAALRDLNARLHAEPSDAAAAFQRGRVWLYKGDLVRALADFTRADTDPAFLYPALWRFAARGQLGEDGVAELAERLARARKTWPTPVAEMLIGRLSLDAARARAANEGERCEADFYFALSRSKADSIEESATRLQQALKECPTGFIEYEGAKAELRRMGR
jgi:lipoprotein NlpI